MLKRVYISHPVRPNYARETHTFRCVDVRAKGQPGRQGRHNMLWFAKSAWQFLQICVIKTMAYLTFNIITIIGAGGGHAFFATRDPHPPRKSPPLLYMYITYRRWMF